MKKVLFSLLMVLVVISFTSCILLTEAEPEPQPAKEPVKKDVVVVVKSDNPFIGKWRSIYDKNFTIEFNAENELIFKTHGDIDKITTYKLENKKLYVNDEFFPYEFPNGEYKKLYISNNFVSGETTSRFVRITQ